MSHSIFSYEFSSKADRINYSTLLESELEKDVHTNAKETLNKLRLKFE